MDEKIKNLAKLAYTTDSIARNPGWKYNEFTDELLADLDSFFVEFAKLIADDCAKITKQAVDCDADVAQTILCVYGVARTQQLEY